MKRKVIEFEPIGIVHSPFKKPEGTPIQSAVSHDSQAVIEIFPEYGEGLKDLNLFSHLFVMYYFHRVTKKNLTVVPFLDQIEHGIFATRSPARPNPLGLSVVCLDHIKENNLYIRNLDIVDGSPVIDIKPYITDFDIFNSAKNGWVEKNMHLLRDRRDDGRFSG